MKLKITIKMDTAAFEPDRTAELVRILERLTQKVIADWPGENHWAVGLIDINSNHVGTAKVTH